MNAVDTMTIADLALQATAAVILVILCELAKRSVKRAARRRIGR